VSGAGRNEIDYRYRYRYRYVIIIIIKYYVYLSMDGWMDGWMDGPPTKGGSLVFLSSFVGERGRINRK
jgi:hypothetical protein